MYATTRRPLKWSPIGLAIALALMSACLDEGGGAVDSRMTPDEVAPPAADVAPADTTEAELDAAETPELDETVGPDETDADETDADETDDGDAEVEVGPQPACPVAVIDSPERDVVLGTFVHLYGDDSYSPEGGLLEYAWQVDAPEGSVSDFVPRATIANPTFVTDVAGTYRFTLSVSDQRGLPGCVAATHEVVAAAAPGLRIELTWSAPNDPDPTDDNGPDLDLHFLHPLASGAYFADPFDTFWANHNPNWGSLGSTVDNPDLTDSTSGSSPEVLTLIAPEAGSRYCVGVNVWTDHDFGPSDASLRIFVHGELAFEVVDVLLAKHDLWQVTCFMWPVDVIVLSTIDGALDITPDYQHPRWFQP